MDLEWELAVGDAWIPATVPGTVAGALRDAGLWTGPDGPDLDAQDWTFRTTFVSDGGPKVLRLGGIATIADVLLNNELVLHSESMFRSHALDVTTRAGENELVIRCAALLPLLGVKRPRPRWRTRLVEHAQLRWFRTTFLGRMPSWSPWAAPVGPWRPVEVLDPAPTFSIRARCDRSDGLVEVTTTASGNVCVGDVTAPIVDGVATVRVVDCEHWWPHTHGLPARYAVWAEVDGTDVDLGHVGFRTIAADTTDGDFRLRVNGVPVFARGGCWTPPDPVSLQGDPRPTLELVRDAGMNMVRIPGTMPYESVAFWDACDELGILVWQDLAFANLDPPDDETFLAEVDAEVRQVLGELGGRPSLAVVCGGSEVEQQAAMMGLPPDRRAMPLLDLHLPSIVAEVRPDVVWVRNSPTGGDLPFHANQGVSHYYGVSAYLRPLEDARRADVRFASECLAFAVPPERATVDEVFGGPSAAGHRPRWKAAVPRDNGASWDFEDVREHYVRELFGDLRYNDPERNLDLGRAVVAHLSEGALSEWRRPGSRCAGALLLMLRDLWPGAGWGFIDALGRPKAPYWALKRVLQPVALLATDEGLNGLHLHVVNDTQEALAATIDVELFDVHGQRLESASTEVKVAARDGVQLSADPLFEGFRDLTYAYRFGPQTYDVIVATLRETGSQVVHLPGGVNRPVEADIGLTVERDGNAVTIGTTRFAQYVQVDVPGTLASDSWFHLAPGATRTIELQGQSGQQGDGKIDGVVRALNSATSVRVR